MGSIPSDSGHIPTGAENKNALISPIFWAHIKVPQLFKHYPEPPPPIGFLTACELLSEIKPQSLISQFHRYLNKIIGVDPVLELPLVAAQQIFCSIVVTDMPYILTLLPLQKN